MSPGPAPGAPPPPSTPPAAPPAVERVVSFDRLSDFSTADRRTFYLAAIAVGVGLAGALLAVALLGLIGLVTNLAYYGRLSWSFVSPADNRLGWLALGVPVLGGLIVGGMARLGSDRIRGHGIPEALEAILVRKSRIEPRLTVLKPVSAAIAIGTGGPFGAEGPIIMTGGSLGSVVGQTLHLSAAERKTLLVAGAAAGMAATFNAPIAAVLIAVELLLFEWRPRSLIPVGVAALVATFVRWEILGSAALFPLPEGPLPSVPIAAGALVVGLVAGGLSTVLTLSVYAVEDLYHKLPVHWMWWPALGGLAVGAGGLLDPRVLGVGYGTIDLVLAGGLGVAAVATLLATKAFVWTVSLSSGTSGGVLAPLLMMGAAMGALVGAFLPVATPSFWALIALGAILGGSMRVPFTGVLFALELTGDLNALLPLFVATVAAYGVTVFTLRRSILTEKIARRGVHTAREYAVDPLEVTPVRAVMHSDIVEVPPPSPVGVVARSSPERTDRYIGYSLVDADGRTVGFTTKAEIANYLAEGGDPERPVAAIAHPPAPALEPDHPMRVGMALLAELDRESLPVAEPGRPDRIVGFFAREDLFEGRVLALEEEQERDRVIPVTFPTLRLTRGPLGMSPGRRSRSDRTGPAPPPSPRPPPREGNSG